MNFLTAITYQLNCGKILKPYLLTNNVLNVYTNKLYSKCVPTKNIEKLCCLFLGLLTSPFGSDSSAPALAVSLTACNRSTFFGSYFKQFYPATFLFLLVDKTLWMLTVDLDVCFFYQMKSLSCLYACCINVGTNYWYNKSCDRRTLETLSGLS